MSELIDLTKIMDKDLPIYAEEGYSDPPLEISDWCSIETQGYKVSRLCLGTQTGTHLDAPAHFAEGGATLEALPLSALVGAYLLIDLKPGVLPSITYRGETFLFLRAENETASEISEAFFDSLLALPCPVWVIVYDVRVTGRGIFHFNQKLAQAGKFLIENVDEQAARQVPPGGELFALPLRLTGVSGSPCRVVVRRN